MQIIPAHLFQCLVACLQFLKMRESLLVHVAFGISELLMPSINCLHEFSLLLWPILPQLRKPNRVPMTGSTSPCSFSSACSTCDPSFLLKAHSASVIYFALYGRVAVAPCSIIRCTHISSGEWALLFTMISFCAFFRPALTLPPPDGLLSCAKLAALGYWCWVGNDQLHCKTTTSVRDCGAHL